MRNKSITTILAGLLAIPVIAFSVGLIAPIDTLAKGVSDLPGVSTQCTNNLDADTGAACARGDGQRADLFGTGGIFNNIANAALFIIGAISVLMLIYGGIRYTTSGGNEKGVTAAKNTILYAVVGIVVALLAYAIVNFVLTSLVA